MNPVTLSGHGIHASAYWRLSADGPTQQREQRSQALVSGQVVDRNFFAVGVA